MRDAFFFGYGSLVNRKTHGYGDALPATIRGWRREWRRSQVFGRTFLSAVPDAHGRIDGLIARVPEGDWAALDRREAGYSRHFLRPEDVTGAAGVSPQLYAIAPDVSVPACSNYPFRVSYLDVVIAGFLAEFGEAGVARFFQSTTGWGAMLDDRANPLYARAIPVAPAVRDLIDMHLRESCTPVLAGL